MYKMYAMRFGGRHRQVGEVEKSSTPGSTKITLSSSPKTATNSHRSSSYVQFKFIFLRMRGTSSICGYVPPTLPS